MLRKVEKIKIAVSAICVICVIGMIGSGVTGHLGPLVALGIISSCSVINLIGILWVTKPNNFYFDKEMSDLEGKIQAVLTNCQESELRKLIKTAIEIGQKYKFPEKLN